MHLQRWSESRSDRSVNTPLLYPINFPIRINSTNLNVIKHAQLCNDAAGTVTPPRTYNAKLITPLSSVDNSTTQYQLIVKLADQVCPGQSMEVYMQVGVGGADPVIVTTNTTFQQTYKMFWYRKDISQWNIMCDSSWKYVSQNYSTIRVWAQVPDVIFNHPGFDAQAESVCPSTDPCVGLGYCCGPISGDTKVNKPVL
jgi:hypothetical protein